jgi:hypothetical protein
MNKLVLVLLAISFSVSAHAQDSKREMRLLLSDISRELDITNAPESDLQIAKSDLARALEILRNGGRTGPSEIDILCVSRDNDGNEPYNLAIRDPRDFSLKKIPGAVLHKADCESATRSAITLGRVAYVCASRDGDANTPYGVFAVDDMGESLKMKAVGTFAQCESALAGALRTRQAAAVCMSRDNDGNTPWARFTYNVTNKTVQQVGDTFSSLDACNASR